MGRSSWMAEENIDMKQGVENTCVGIRDLTKYELDVDGIDDPGQANVMDGPVVAGILNDNERAKLAESVEYKGQQRKVRKISEVMQPTLTLNEKELAVNQKKKGRGRSRKQPKSGDYFVNGSLFDSDFLNRKRAILKEAEETLQLGRLIGVEP
ncbi:hypothetical protein V6N13_108551 [Hibiscus sabdariffa]